MSKEIDALIAIYHKKMPNNVALVKNKERYDEIECAIKDIAELVLCCDSQAKIDISPDELTGSSVCVTISSSLVVIDIVDKFCDALRKADNFEVYPRSDGSIGLGIVFEDAFKSANPLT